jgi:hypothetical protein
MPELLIGLVTVGVFALIILQTISRGRKRLAESDEVRWTTVVNNFGGVVVVAVLVLFGIVAVLLDPGSEVRPAADPKPEISGYSANSVFEDAAGRFTVTAPATWFVRRKESSGITVTPGAE